MTARNIYRDEELPPPAEGRIDYRDQKTANLVLRVTSTNHRSWCVTYRFKGTPRRFTLGDLTEKHGLVWAREQSEEQVFKPVSNGIDPAARKSQERKAETCRELAAHYIEEYAKKHKRTWRTDENILNKDFVPRFGNRKPADITRADIRRLLKEIEQRGSPIQSNRTFEVVRKLFNWAIGEERGGVEHNPCDHVKKVAKERRRERVLSDDEIRAIWNALPKIDTALANVYRLLFLTAGRKAEVTEMKWSEIDGRWWMLAPNIVGRSKNARPHRVYLTKTALDVLATIAEPDKRKGRVFPSRGKTGLLFAIYDEDVHPELMKTSGTAGWRPHDIRRTIGTNLGKLGFSRFIQDRILNHVDKGVSSIYDVYSYDRERELALTAWEKRLEEIVSGKHSDNNVVAMQRSA